MWQYYNKKNKSLTGPHKTYIRKTPPPPEGRPYKNPNHIPGLCKHQLRLIHLLIQNNILVDVRDFKI